jgi:hypothetical protein
MGTSVGYKLELCGRWGVRVIMRLVRADADLAACGV